MPSLNIEQVYNQIEEQRGVLVGLLNMARKNPISPNRLSDVCMKLSILNELLGDFVSDLKLVQLQAERTLYNEAIQSGTSITAAVQNVRMETIEQRNAWEKADTKHKDLWKLISMAQSHIRAETEERKM